MASTETYKFQGSSRPDTVVTRFVPEGGSAEDAVAKGDTLELTEEQLKSAKASGLKFTKVNKDGQDEDENSGDTSPSTPAEQQASQRPNTATEGVGSPRLTK